MIFLRGIGAPSTLQLNRPQVPSHGGKPLGAGYSQGMSRQPFGSVWRLTRDAQLLTRFLNRRHHRFLFYDLATDCRKQGQIPVRNPIRAMPIREESAKEE